MTFPAADVAQLAARRTDFYLHNTVEEVDRTVIAVGQIAIALLR